MADTFLILALPSFRSLWLFPMSVLSFSPNCWLRSWASQDLVHLFTPRLLMNAPIACWMTCTMHGMWCVDAGHSIPEALRIDCNSRVIKQLEEMFCIVNPSNLPSVSSKRSRTSFKCRATSAPVCWLLTCNCYVAFKKGKNGLSTSSNASCTLRNGQFWDI